MRSLYRLLIRLHPPGFRRRFEDEMLLIFDETAASGQSTALLLGDALVSLFRRWVLRRAGWSTGSHSLQPRTWWLLASCGVLDAIYSGMMFFMQGPDGYLTLRTSVDSNRTLVHVGVLALAAGAVTIAAGICSYRDRKSWLVGLIVVNGLASSALGLILCGTFGFRIGFGSLARLTVLMALSIGVYELVTARTLLHHTDQWVLGAAGVLSLAFAGAFLAFAYGWIQLEPRPLADFLWFGSYFGFSAICMLWLALHLHGPGPFQDHPLGTVAPARDPNTHTRQAGLPLTRLNDLIW
jgi:hypothetical protein